MELTAYNKRKQIDEGVATMMAERCISNYENHIYSTTIAFHGYLYPVMLRLKDMVEAMMYSSGYWVESVKHRVPDTGYYDIVYTLKIMSESEKSTMLVAP